jgi:co-chaperonin GroES (HSP10)
MNENKGTLHAKANWVIVEKFEADVSTASGIVVTSSEDPDLGRVISVGPQVTSCAVGDVVAPDWSKAILVRHLTCALREEDVVAWVEPASRLVMPIQGIM